MEYTQNYHLPQWNEDDRILMPDFNAAMAAIETGLTATQTASESALTGLGTGGQNCRVEVGTYVGNGGSSVTRTFPFTPALLFVVERGAGIVPGIMLRGNSAAPGPYTVLTPITWGDRTVSWTCGTDVVGGFNISGITYVYVCMGYTND